MISTRVGDRHGKELGALILRQVEQFGYVFGDRPGRGTLAGLQPEQKGLDDAGKPFGFP